MKLREQTPSEEIVNAILHGIGVGLSIAALVILVIFANIYGDTWHLVSFSIYGATLIIMYLSSTLYHSFTIGKWKNILHVLDHSSIFLLIAGTYTPITLTAMRGPWGWSIFGVIWGIALLGIISKIFWMDKFKFLSVALYFVMGWLIVIAIRPLIDSLNTISLVFLVAGGLSYTIGIVFYIWRKLKYSHGIWHLFVLAGSICHFFTVFYLLPE
ncbi:MAG: hemolysin III family protein [Bacteroidetes bacterium]|nr:MAG: hemolysin III family protein [Bacteroidota bacterium]